MLDTECSTKSAAATLTVCCILLSTLLLTWMKNHARKHYNALKMKLQFLNVNKRRISMLALWILNRSVTKRLLNLNKSKLRLNKVMMKALLNN